MVFPREQESAALTQALDALRDLAVIERNAASVPEDPAERDAVASGTP